MSTLGLLNDRRPDGLLFYKIEGNGFAPTLYDGWHILMDPRQSKGDRAGPYVCRDKFDGALRLMYLEPVSDGRIAAGPINATARVCSVERSELLVLGRVVSIVPGDVPPLADGEAVA